MRKWILLIVAVLAFSACNKPYTTNIALGVNNETIQLPSFEEGHCFITVFSSGSWTIRIEEGSDWARLGQTSGSGIDYVRFDYDENFSGVERVAVVLVEGSGKQCRIEIKQPGE